MARASNQTRHFRRPPGTRGYRHRCNDASGCGQTGPEQVRNFDAFMDDRERGLMAAYRRAHKIWEPSLS